jgi:hypothetical protein
VDDFISGESNEESAEGDDEDTSVTRNIFIDSIEKLGTNNGVGGGPADAGDDVEDGD